MYNFWNYIVDYEKCTKLWGLKCNLPKNKLRTLKQGKDENKIIGLMVK